MYNLGLGDEVPMGGGEMCVGEYRAYKSWADYTYSTYTPTYIRTMLYSNRLTACICVCNAMDINVARITVVMHTRYREQVIFLIALGGLKFSTLVFSRFRKLVSCMCVYVCMCARTVTLNTLPQFSEVMFVFWTVRWNALILHYRKYQ